MLIRLLTNEDSIAALTDCLHAAYARLGAMGFNYTAVDPTEEVTRKRIEGGECWLAVDGDDLVGTITFRAPGHSKGTPHFERTDVATLGQFAVSPAWQGQGVGVQLVQRAEDSARAAGAAHLALDTAEGASHLVRWYERRGFHFVEFAQWRGKTYRSVIMSKPV